MILARPADLMREQWLDKLNQSEILRNAKPRFDYVLIDPDPCRNFYRMYGPDGSAIDIQVDTSYSKEHNSTSGRIVAMPSRISKTKDWGPGLLDGIQVGDRVYTHFNCIDSAVEAGYGVEDENGYMYVMVHVSMLYCAVRYPGEIMMIPPHILVQPIEEDSGSLISESGIIMKSQAGKIAQRAIVTHVSKINGREPEFQPGDEIMFETDGEFEMVIEGEKYYKQTHNEVMGIIIK